MAIDPAGMTLTMQTRSRMRIRDWLTPRFVCSLTTSTYIMRTWIALSDLVRGPFQTIFKNLASL